MVRFCGALTLFGEKMIIGRNVLIRTEPTHRTGLTWSLCISATVALTVQISYCVACSYAQNRRISAARSPKALHLPSIGVVWIFIVKV